MQEKLILEESLFIEQNNDNIAIYKEIAKQVRDEIVTKYGNFIQGKCIEASDRIVELLEAEGISASAVEGWVSYDDDSGCTDRPYDEHTWVETKDDYVIDVTADQFNPFMDEDYPKIIISEELPYNFSYDEPNYIDEDDYDSDDQFFQNLIKGRLTEARKKKTSKKKKNKNKLSFKGFGWWPIYIDDEDHNCGNMEYNNDMFNKMMGNADSSIDVGDGGEGAIGGMGESFIFTPKSEKLDISDSLKGFINSHQDLINRGEWKELFILTDKECLSYRDQGILAHILKDVGVIDRDDF